MCNCAELAEVWLGPGVGAFPAFEGKLEGCGDGSPVYRCQDCGQHWYVEWAREQPPTPVFGFKLPPDRADAPPTPGIVRTKQQLALILAHGGFSDFRCQQPGCCSFALKGSPYCQAHHP